GGLGSDRNADGTCKHQSATCMDYDVTMNRCLEPLNGYRSKLYVELIENKLKTQNPSTQEKKRLKEDLEGLKDAVKNKTDNPTIAGEKNSQRHIQDVTMDEQSAVNQKYGVKYQEIMNKCMGADHMGV